MTSIDESTPKRTSLVGVWKGPDVPIKQEGVIRFVCLSDTHTFHSKLSIPDGDVLLHAGDFTLKATEAEFTDFNDFMGSLPHKHKIVVLGNHDIYAEDEAPKVLSNCRVLKNERITIEGISIHGSPWINVVLDAGIWKKMVASASSNPIDIVLCHGPPHGGLGGQARGIDSGSKSLTQAVFQIKPQVVVYGHIHEGYGIYNKNDITFINGANCTAGMSPLNAPIVFDLKCIVILLPPDSKIFLLVALIGCLPQVLASCNITADDEPGFQLLSESFNRLADASFKYPPVLHVSCDSVQETASVIKILVAAGINISPASGRHSAAGFSGGGSNDPNRTYAVLSAAKLNSPPLIFQEGSKTFMQVSAGTHFFEVVKALNGTPYWFFGGSCPSVMLTGLTMAGGYSWVARLVGLALDSLRSVELISWNGTIITASKNSHSQLFFALRGAGGIGRFGFVTKLTYELQVAPPVVSVVDLTWNWTSPESALPFLSNWNEQAPTMDPRCSLSLQTIAGSWSRMRLGGICAASNNTTTEMLTEAGFLNTTLWPSSTYEQGSHILETSWDSAFALLSECGSIQNCIEYSHRGPRENVYNDTSDAWTEQSYYFFKPLPAETLLGILNLTKTMCGDTPYFCGALFTPDGNNTATCRNVGEDASFPNSHRCAHAHLELQANTRVSDQETTQKSLERFEIAVADLLSLEGVVNQPYLGYVAYKFCATYPGRLWAELAFDHNETTIQTLCQVHCEWDPNNVAIAPGCSFDFCQCSSSNSLRSPSPTAVPALPPSVPSTQTSASPREPEANAAATLMHMTYSLIVLASLH